MAFDARLERAAQDLGTRGGQSWGSYSDKGLAQRVSGLVLRVWTRKRLTLQVRELSCRVPSGLCLLDCATMGQGSGITSQ